MTQSSLGKTAAAVVLMLACASVAAQPKGQDFGRSEYEANCASCHGVDGKGVGPLQELLRTRPTDLTLLAKNNQGIFPLGRLYDVIDGQNVPSHGTREMPVWGRDYRIKDAAYYMDVPYDAAALVRSRILALLEYINRIQAP